MSRPDRLLDRRHFLTLGAAATLHGTLGRRGALAGNAPARPRIAAVYTDFRYRYHAHVILENFLEPYLFNGDVTDPGCEVVSFYADQSHQGDMTWEVARKYGIPVFSTIGEALRVGRKDLAVDGVLSIGEHGRYPRNRKGQVEYPRKRFFDEIVAVFRQSGRVVPVFNDKHLSYRWDWAKEMVDTARELHIPFLAGSSVPLAQRRPVLEIPPGTRIVEAVSIHGGPVESYDFHGLEVLQSLVEARRGHETGVQQVQFLDEPALWKAAEEGRWSPQLAEAALSAELGPGQPPLRELLASKRLGRQPSHGILIDYVDGLHALMLKVGSSSTRWDFACRAEGHDEPLATSFYVGPWNNRNLFKALSHAIQTMFRTGEAPYSIERTLLTTGVLDAAMDSRAGGGQPIATPQLRIVYEGKDFRGLREMGKSWTMITDQTPEPQGVERVLPAATL
jgi:hypothetical protein